MKSIVRTLMAVLTLAAATVGYAEIPAGYYTSINGLSDGALKTALSTLSLKFTTVSSYNALPQYFQKTDVYPNSKRWWDMYSDIPLYAPSFSGLNREHSFPKSWWGGSTTTTAYVDLNHLYPSEMAANMAKSNYPLGVVDRSRTVDFQNGITTVGIPVTGQGGGAKMVFEPADEYKGDFARTYFYMVTTYQGLTWSYKYMVQQNLYPTLTPWAINLLMKWHREDPVSEKETLRNEAVYRIQNNRNPFIDYPQLAEHLWGNKQGVAFNLANPGTSGKATLITPVQDMALDFGQVALGQSITAKLYFNGENLSAPLSLAIYTGDKALFSIPTRTIAANLVNSEEGYWLPVTYTPTAVGEHTSRMLITDGGLPGSLGISLRGECLPQPTLDACTATAATDITEDSYTANWTYPSANVVDYFVITRTRYNGTETQVEEIEAENSGYLMDGFADSQSETYAVQSVRLGFRSPMSNTVAVQHAGVSDITPDAPIAVYAVPGAIRVECSTLHTNLRVLDALGRTVLLIPEINANTDIPMPAGVYMVVTDQARTPRKVAL